MWRGDSRDVSQQPIPALTSIPFARRVDLLVALVTPEAGWPWAGLVVALVDLGVRVTKLDGNVADQLVLESNGLDTRDGLDDGGLSVSDVADGADVDRCLPRNNLWCERGQFGDVKVLGLGLGRQDWLLNDGRWCGLLQGGLERLLLLDFVVRETLASLRAGRLVARVGGDVISEFIDLAVCRHGDGVGWKEVLSWRGNRSGTVSLRVVRPGKTCDSEIIFSVCRVVCH